MLHVQMYYKTTPVRPVLPMNACRSLAARFLLQLAELEATEAEFSWLIYQLFKKMTTKVLHALTIEETLLLRILHLLLLDCGICCCCCQLPKFSLSSFLIKKCWIKNDCSPKSVNQIDNYLIYLVDSQEYKFRHKRVTLF